MGAGLKKDLRVSKVGPGGSLNAFFFLLIGVISHIERSCYKEVPGVTKETSSSYWSWVENGN